METSIYERLNDIHYFIDYRADESNYGLQNPNIIYCAHKLNDIYSVYCIARANLHYIDSEDFGDFAKEDSSIKFVKIQLAMNALHYYNILIDFSWQLVWFYIRTDLNSKMLTTKTYNDVAKECNFELLSFNLTLLKDLKMRDDILKCFFKKPEVQIIRERWNFLKHRGTYYFNELGINPEYMMLKLDGMNIPLVNRDEVNIDKLKEELIVFDNTYYEYITYIMDLIFPKDFLSNKHLINSAVNYYWDHKDEIIRWNKKQ